MKRQIPLAWRQLIHKKGRLLVALSGIAFADILMLMQLAFQDALYESNTRLHKVLQADLVLISSQARHLSSMESFPRRRLYQAASVSGIQSAEALYIVYMDWRNPQTHRNSGILLLGFDPDRPVLNLPGVTQNLDKLKLKDTLLFDSMARGKYQDAIAQIAQGGTVTTEMGERTIELKGLFSIGPTLDIDGTLIASDQTFLRIVSGQPGNVATGLITLEPGVDLSATATALKSHLPGDVRVLTRQEFIDFEQHYWRTQTPIGFIFNLGAVLGFVVGVIIVYQILDSDVGEHIKEYATLKAIGYRSLYLLGIVLQEALILAVLGYIPGNLIATALYALTSGATNLPLYMTLDRTIKVLIFTILMCMISGSIAVRKLRSADPAEIF
ncbi:MAG: FtsX-like permease family protein [Cyanobacteria bacterium CRU_2_1]|nr:FtsX-like permease family protein [Cyanobacteria bacterium CRU_2_1]